MEAHEPALPLLNQAHKLLWEVREACEDEPMRQNLEDALRRVRRAQRRLRRIDLEARLVVED